MKFLLKLFLSIYLGVALATVASPARGEHGGPPKLVAVSPDGKVEVHIYADDPCTLPAVPQALVLEGRASLVPGLGHAAIVIPNRPDTPACYVFHDDPETHVDVMFRGADGLLYKFSVPAEYFKVPAKVLPKGGAQI